MKTYVIATGLIFGMLALAHIWRIIWENPNLLADPMYLLITAAAAGMGLWACLVLRRSNSAPSRSVNDP